MDERPTDPELDAVIAELVSAGLITVGTDAEGRETWTLTEMGVQVSNQMAMSGQDEGLALLEALLEDAEGGTASP
jgi:hypothetical protein